MSQRKESWYYSTIQRLYNYPGHVKKLVTLTKRLNDIGPNITPVYSSQPHGSGTSDPTGNQGDRVFKLQMEIKERTQEIELIDLSVSMLSLPKQLIIKVRYMTEGGLDKGAAVTLRNHSRKYQWRVMQHNTYEKLRDEAVKEIAEMLGEINVTTISQ